jgi:hypothetical protein
LIAPSPPDLFITSLDAIIPAPGQNGPRLWVRRLIIWSAPRQQVREITLRPGLNVVWSPDADDTGNSMGHGGGKTSLCRLLRYCLGEDSFGSEEQRLLIGTALPDAHVGAEIMLDDQLWVVVRPIGNPRGRHLAQMGGTLETAFHAEMPNTGISPLRQAIVRAIMPLAVLHMPVGNSPDEGWEAALAWISRDQECRLLDALSWRSPQTESRSPARRLSESERLTMVRLLLNALTPEEIEVTRAAREHERRAKAAIKRRERIEWIRDDVGRGLSETFGGDPAEDPGTPDLWKYRADVDLKAKEETVDPEIEAKIRSAQVAVEEMRAKVAKVETRLAVIDASLAGLGDLLRTLNNEVPKAETRVRDAQNPRCLSCGQTIPTEVQTYIDEQIAARDLLVVQRSDTEKKRHALLLEQQSLKPTLAADVQEFTRREASAARLLQTALDQSRCVSAAKGHVTMTARYQMYETELASVHDEIAHAQEEQAKANRHVTELRRGAQAALGRLSDYFDAVIRFLIPNGARGVVTLDDNGIHPSVLQRGNLATAAVDSLKIISLDIAVLILTIEGRTQLPGFLLHDSPREADLGLSLYHKLFELARMLESVGPAPAFQYIVTTTTEPPSRLQGLPWLRLTLHNTPPEARLFCRDL